MQKEELYRLIESPGLLGNESLEGLKSLVEKFPYFQLGWLLYLKNLKNLQSPEYDRVLKNVAVRVPDRRLLFKWLNNEKDLASFYASEVAPSFHLNDNIEQGKPNLLIDKFLSSNSAIQPRKNIAEGQSTGELQKEILEKSLSENGDMVTETLATIYLQQKKYDKAIESFRKLSLKYPEKSAYFASRIEEIENLKNI